ncbi:hypothetical protein GF336_04755 [Candidatus Woesearchaeota archaeon]|nr:hypothetical protein [Candidatus Woesearchaeota archaeon]
MYDPTGISYKLEGQRESNTLVDHIGNFCKDNAVEITGSTALTVALLYAGIKLYKRRCKKQREQKGDEYETGQFESFLRDGIKCETPSNDSHRYKPDP